MAQIQILDAATSPGEWQRWLDRLPGELRDVYFSPHYGQVYVTAAEQSCVLYTYEEAGDIWLYPFLKNRLPDYLKNPNADEWCDIESCHGYCGPLANTDNNGFVERATASFDEWCQQEKIVAEFVRLHPLLDNQRWLSSKAEIVMDRKTVSLELRGNDGAPFAISKNGMEMVKKAARSGMDIKCVDDDRSIASFFDLYDQTMQRMKADRFYYFDQDQFSALAGLVKSAGWLITATIEGHLVAGAIFLRGRNLLHYHLSATDPNRRIPGATNAIIHHAAVTGRAHKLTRLHLGGGTTRDENDSLLKFKRKMASDEHTYAFAKRVHRSEVYDGLRDSWRHLFPELVRTFGNRLLCYRYGGPKTA